MPAHIEDYALIGDGHTAALISREGSVDWLCWPRFDSGACFAALLGSPDNGRWLIAPATEGEHGAPTITRRYRGETLILETDFETPDGAVTLIDFMPPGNGWSELIRIVVGKRGTVRMKMELVLRFDYGFSIPWVDKLKHDSGIKAIVGPDNAVLRTPVELHGEDMKTIAEFTVTEGERVPFSLAYAASHLRIPPARDPHTSLARTENHWLEWAARGTVEGRWAGPIRRSLITLRALAYEPTGGIVAAPTTSLPERLGGTRNWDYRYCWLRDATITLLAMMRGGYYDEARAWRSWLGRVMAGAPDQLQIMYGIGGERRLPESEIDWLPGYEGAKPVRIGNNAVGQRQLDVYGEVMNALHLARVGGLQADVTAWSVQRALLEHLSTIWREPDEGIWETRGGPEHFTFSKVMAWVAFDRAIRSAEMFKLDGPLDEWRATRDTIHAEVCEKAWNPQLNAFSQYYGSDQLDASVLLMPLVAFLPPQDPRIKGTVEAIERDLMHGGFVLRYRTTEYDDGLPPGEGTFLACSFWMVDNLALQGRVQEATEMYERLLALCNDVGLLSEEYDPVDKRLVGNFPQAFSHVALVNTGLNLMKHEQEMAQATGHPAHDGIRAMELEVQASPDSGEAASPLA
ncbi:MULTISPECIES: glycoside hydrolase family 15 protein [unclassified Paraburkholderia]|uniref:glycoside hydrolase family 15 protein n=1 Tax=unclassified Paraburkholderia TaxID=2615204 RepID=UPI00160B7E40|nr:MULTISPECIES: glycoside hydrolase family 15 protein [unclassified Paraburkholderia]MBB5407973.1 GH15 family glucan-1,4-alpha-glucosidase [Paraburkholderia sp. HC6.4b]MBB5453565.1 GH15 family glucan-1,4-alpha-glucosidase [Paraburkholderia sp. Kb1A]MBB5497395.1 GH15 family glucan-1,4-alpha-glucosidase [Paraburkholderia sp. MM5384-R2]